MSIETYDLPSLSLTAEPLGKNSFVVGVICLERPLTGIEKDSLSRTLSSSHLMTAEIKRLEAENATMHRRFTDEVDLKVAPLRARIAALEAALRLPEGCDVFELERAQKEGAVDENGLKWFFVESDGEFHKFRIDSHAKFDGHWFNSKGENYHAITRLYCIKEGV